MANLAFDRLVECFHCTLVSRDHRVDTAQSIKEVSLLYNFYIIHSTAWGYILIKVKLIVMKTWFLGSI